MFALEIVSCILIGINIHESKVWLKQEGGDDEIRRPWSVYDRSFLTGLRSEIRNQFLPKTALRPILTEKKRKTKNEKRNTKMADFFSFSPTISYDEKPNMANENEIDCHRLREFELWR